MNIPIRNLHLQAFRGIKTEIDIDMSAPLTVIYAPNGTGKTTICDGAEWLFTGLIERFNRATLKDLIRCKFSPDELQTSVSCTFIDNTSFIVRDFEGWTNEKGDALTDREVLTLLAPSGASDDLDTRSANIARRIWIRGSRFLSGETMSLLLDSDESSLRSREQIFSDLLGVRHLLEAEKKISNYMEYISKGINSLYERIQMELREIHAIESEIIDTTAMNMENALLSLNTDLSKAFTLLKSDDAENIDDINDKASFNRIIGKIENGLSKHQYLISERKQARLIVLKYWDARGTIDNEYFGLINDKERFEMMAKEISSSIEDLIKKITNTTNTIQQENSTLNELHYFINNSTSVINDIINALHTLSNMRTSSIRATVISDILSLFDLSLFNDQEYERRNNYLSYLLSEFRMLIEKEKDIKELVVQRDVLSKYILEDREAFSLSERKASLTSQLKAMRDKYNNTANPLQQLRILSQQIIRNLETETKCPVCGHDWKQRIDLVGALNSINDTVPDDITHIYTFIINAEKELLEIDSRIDKSNQAKGQKQNIDGTILSFNENKSELYSRIKDQQINTDNNDIEEAIEGSIKYNDLALFAMRLNGLFQNISTYSIYEDILKLEINSFNNGIQILLSNIVNTTKINININVDQLKLLEKEKIDRMQYYDNIKASLQLNMSRLEQLIAQKSEFESAWITFSKGTAVDDANLKVLSDYIAHEEENISEIKSILEGAISLFDRLCRTREIEDKKAQSKNITEKLTDLEKHLATAKRARTEYQNRRYQHCSQQFKALKEVISNLYLRMQANILYEEISLNENDAQFRWIPIAEDRHFDVSSHFSDGQRKDLALSIFITRARSLGGTFVLDEPIIHLDDLNRLALLDLLRMLTMERESKTHFVITTANKPLVRHLAEKFSLIEWMDIGNEKTPPLRIIEMDGNARYGVRISNTLSIGKN